MKKQYILLKIAFLFYIFSFSLFAAQSTLPLWFHHLQGKSYELFGYGVDGDLSTARNMAKNEVAESLRVRVQSSFSLNQSLEGTKAKQSAKSSLHTQADAILEGIEVVKEVQKDGKWYVALKYDNRPLFEKIQAKYPHFKKPHLQEVHLVRKSNAWYLNVKGELFLLSKENFIELFENHDSNITKLSLNKNKFNSYDKMEFNLQTKKEGFVSLFNVESGGKVALLFANVKVKKSLHLPRKSDDALIAYNPSQKTITEMYVAIYSKKKLDLREFERVGTELLDGSNYNFHKLLAIIQKYNFTSLRVKIKGN